MIGDVQEQLQVTVCSSHVIRIVFFLDLFFVGWSYQSGDHRQGHEVQWGCFLKMKRSPN